MAGAINYMTVGSNDLERAKAVAFFMLAVPLS